ncbi:hypothetical protein WICMUC_004158 [Wickerhamomyces mucosus]|uniref:Uncharacterized protein n=1 Tax=Wickerhamomyces mucosus TaxID=1378264 RepID=A0A9P8PIK1_9ASCO|nr:hypothetical protein WICMUC_004158 [Wickerhamomyces mucosus]
MSLRIESIIDAGHHQDNSIINSSSTINNLQINNTNKVQNRWNLKTETCILHPINRKLRHLQGIYLRNLSIRQNVEIFVSLHDINNNDEILYITEVNSNCFINVDFQQFNLNYQNLYSNEIKLKIWVNYLQNNNNWNLFNEIIINLKSLLYLNKSLDNVKVPNLMGNIILIGLIDGIYLLPLNQDVVEEYKRFIFDNSNTYNDDDLKPNNINGYTRKIVDSMTFDLTIKLKNFEKINYELMKMKLKISNQINKSLNQYQLNLNDLKINNIDVAINSINVEINSKQLELNSLNLQVSKSMELINSSSNDFNLNEIDYEYNQFLEINNSILKDLNVEKIKIIKSIHQIYLKNDIIPNLININHNNIHDNINFDNNFEILPILNINLITKSQNFEKINSSLGYLVQMILIISYLFKIPLRYKLKFIGSNSFIIDDLNSKINQSTKFPLFNTFKLNNNNNQFMRFKYAIHLLNLNIQDILNYFEDI